MTIDRRRFLALGAGSVTGAVLSACNSRGPESAQAILRFAERQNERLERWLHRSGSRDRVADGALLSGKSFPKYYISDRMPVWDERARGIWQLEVNGAVRTPLRITLDELSRLRAVTQRVNHYCVEGWVARAEWTGVRMSELARLAGATADAQFIDFQSFDSDYHESWDMESAMHPQTIVAYGMDGRFLGPGHGAPARVHSPVKLGYKNTKYLTRIVFLPSRNGGYWSDQGYEWYAGV